VIKLASNLLYSSIMLLFESSILALALGQLSYAVALPAADYTVPGVCSSTGGSFYGCKFDVSEYTYPCDYGSVSSWLTQNNDNLAKN
jgi:hypothetical protein